MWLRRYFGAILAPASPLLGLRLLGMKGGWNNWQRWKNCGVQRVRARTVLLNTQSASNSGQLIERRDPV
jgi:hypothetical protein